MWSRGHKARGQGQGHKKVRGQGLKQPFRRQTLSRPRTGMLENKAQDTGASVLQNKKKVFKIIFRRSPKKGLQNFFQAIYKILTIQKNTAAVFEPRTGQFFENLRLRGQGQGIDLRGQGKNHGHQNVSLRTSSRPRTSSRTPSLVKTIL